MKMIFAENDEAFGYIVLNSWELSHQKYEVTEKVF